MQYDLQQFIGQPVEIIYLDAEQRTVQRKIDILTAGDQCIFAYCFNRKDTELFKNQNILAVISGKSRIH
ncbi:hypothetical protein [Gorillibacterium massiliense]|uniref:hypothetical protein n=1 Tax=Gorillibacterium massiliense TaxID=1280390 RepID=UPI0004AF1016|nr:hypothetical protein [Gorillibacterium massiliense]